MSIPVTCPACAKELTVRPEAAGKRVKCPVCADVFFKGSPGDEGQADEQPLHEVEITRPFFLAFCWLF